MRILVVGLTGQANLALVKELLNPTTLKWDVITSFKPSMESWEKEPWVSSTTQFKNLKAAPARLGTGLIFEVVAASFFEKPWVQQELKTNPHLIVITGNPIGLGKDVCARFDRVYLTPTKSQVKIQEFYQLLIDATTVDLEAFQSTLRSLGPEQYVNASNRKVLVESRTRPTASPEETKRPDPPAPVIDSAHVRLEVRLLSPTPQAVKTFQRHLKHRLIESMFSKIEYDGPRVVIQTHRHRTDLFVALLFNVLTAMKADQVIAGGELVV